MCLEYVAYTKLVSELAEVHWLALVLEALGMKQEALDAWRKLKVQIPDASTKTFEDWWRLWNFSDSDMAKLMDGVHKSGVIGAEG